MKCIFIKTLILLTLIFLSFKTTQAQFVTIPDPDLVIPLTISFPGCMSGNQMDTTCSAIINCTSYLIDGSNNTNIDDLTGIQYFDNLQSLEITNMLNPYIPALPPNLIYLDCGFNQLTTLPPLPNSITELKCWYNSLSSLPNIPNQLEYLYCNNNQLTVIPNVPTTLRNLTCNDNLLTSLPSLPYLLEFINCRNNLITCLPQLYENLNFLTLYELENNPFNCLPNYVSVMDATLLSIPLCSAGNINGCNVSSGILGNVFEDTMSNCVLDPTEIGLKNAKVKIFNPITNQFGIAFSASNGVYNYPANFGTYIALLDTLNKPFEVICQYPGIDTILVTTINNPLADNINYSVSCKPGVDLNVQSVHHSGLCFPGQPHTLQILVGQASQWYGLNCANGTSGQVQITINGPVTYNGVAPGALTPIVNGNIFTYNISDFATINNAEDFNLLFTTNINAQINDFVCVNVQVTPIIGDNNPTDNIKDYCYRVVNSYDPNYKEVYPIDVGSLFNDWFTYTIHFQNLGTAPAIFIKVLDTLDSNLDYETLEVINYSHNCITALFDSILDFRFPNILLPDSASNPSGSQGFVQYRIKPKANLIAGTQIENTAHIYFDYNPAVVTNTTVNNFITTVVNKSLPQASRLWLYPNPSTGIFTISAKANIEVYNIVGDLIISENNATSIDLTAAPKGMYFVKLNGGKIEKLIKN